MEASGSCNARRQNSWTGQGEIPSNAETTGIQEPSGDHFYFVFLFLFRILISISCSILFLVLVSGDCFDSWLLFFILDDYLFIRCYSKTLNSSTFRQSFSRALWASRALLSQGACLNLASISLRSWIILTTRHSQFISDLSELQKSAEDPSESSAVQLMRSSKSASGFRGVSRAGSR